MPKRKTQLPRIVGTTPLFPTDPAKPIDVTKPTPRIRSVILKTPWKGCHICGEVVEEGTRAVWSPIRKNWRHATCVAPMPDEAQ